jgi:hypothetical protein
MRWTLDHGRSQVFELSSIGLNGDINLKNALLESRSGRWEPVQCWCFWALQSWCGPGKA